MNDFYEFLGNYAFPIVMCFVLINMNEKQDIRHKEITDKLTSAITDLKDVIADIKERIGDK